MKVFYEGEEEIIDVPKPYCFLPRKYSVQTQAHVESTDLSTFDTDENVKQYFFNTPQNITFFKQIVERNGKQTYEADVKFNNRWMMDNRILTEDFNNYATFDTEEEDSKGKPNPVHAREPITAIGITYHGQTEKWVGSEKDILQNFTQYIRDNKITMLGGWNSYEWDVPFLTKRLNFNNIKFDMRSRRWLDLMWVYKYTKGKGSSSRYSLEYLGNKFLQKQKPFTKTMISSLSDDERKERVGWDSETTWELDQKLGLSKLAIVLGHKSYRFPDEVVGINIKEKKVTVTPVLDNKFLMRAREIGYVLPNKREFGSGYKGAIVYVNKNDEFKNVMQLDFNSMYPNIMIGYNLAPYGKTQLTTPIVKSFLEDKEKSRGNKIDYWAFKVMLNAIYGLMASKYYRFDAKEVASKITEHEREIIVATREFVNSLGYKVLYQDTDSVFIQGLAENEKDFIKNAINKYIKDMFGLDNLKMGYEGYWSFIEFPRGNKEENKKKYYGIKDGKFEVTGLEIVRGDWCDLAKEMQETIMKMKSTYTSKESINGYIEKIVKGMFAGLYDNKLILSKNLGKDVEEYGKVVTNPKTGKMRKNPIPPHVRAYKDAMATGWLPSETYQYGVVNYLICKNGIPKLANMVSLGEISYDYYLSNQLKPILYRLSLIEANDTSIEGRLKGQQTLMEAIQ